MFTALEKQIESAADRFIINKVDISDAHTIRKIKDVIASHNAQAEFTETSYGKVDFDGLFSERPSDRIDAICAGGEDEPLLSEAQLDRIIERALEDQDAQLEPPDRLVCMTGAGCPALWMTSGMCRKSAE